MSPPEDDHRQYALFSLSDAAHSIDQRMLTWEAARIESWYRRNELSAALLEAALYAGMSKADMARITGLSRRQVGRMLREASESV
jgi:hypothetical protein